MTTFITGGTSSIGRILVKQLSNQGERLKVLVRSDKRKDLLPFPGIEFIEGDVSNIDSLRLGMQGCDKVTHMAAVVGGNSPERVWYDVNVEGTRNVLEAAHTSGISSFVQVSSLSVLGHTQSGECADETRPINTRLHNTLYQKTKYAADQIALEYAGNGLSVKIVYPGFGFGCSSASSHASMQEQTLLRMARGEPTGIMGSGKNRVLLAYYNDTSTAINLAHQNGKRGERYILGNESLTFPEIWQGIASILGKKPPKRKIPIAALRLISLLAISRGKDAVLTQDFLDMIKFDWCFSTQKARSELGWQPLSYLQAMSNTWQDYQSQGFVVSS
jgi:nucleoside-diphosphate-sugar epimerase